MKSNPYKIEGPALISFSGGRTSGHMLYHILEAHDFNLPEDVHITFANTGKEMEQTLDFVQECSKRWGVKIHWLELEIFDEKPVYRTKEVTYETASRNGEPFEALVDRKKFLPNPVARFCTAELKIRRMRDFMRKVMGYDHWDNVIGLRYDEPRRVMSARKSADRERWESIMPLYDAEVTKEDVAEFWRNQEFDLQLENYNGVAPEGNCDLCFLKASQTRKNMIKKYPGMADWWIKQEQKFGDHKGATFRKDGPTYIDLVDISNSEVELFDDGLGDCTCHD